MRLDPRRLRAAALPFTVAALAATSAQAQSFVNASSQIPSGSPFNNSFTEAVDFADVDLDGDMDTVNADGGDCCNDQNRLWINQGGVQGGTIGFFQDETSTRFPAVTDTSRDMDFVDIDADGDHDLYVSNTSQIANQTNRFWVNLGGLQSGTAGFFGDQTQARWDDIGTNCSSVSNSLVLGSGGFIDWSCDCVFADLDEDGDIDLLHSTYGGSFAGQVPNRVFLNDGGGNYSEFNPSCFQLSGSTLPNGSPALWAQGTQQDNTSNSDGTFADITGSPLGVELGDLDGDFDIDFLLGSRNTEPRLFLNLLEETGTLAFRDVTASNLTENAIGGGNYENELGDLDSDADLDIYGLNWGKVGQGGLTDITSLNDGNAHFGAFTPAPDSGGDDNEPDFFDYNNDGFLDVFISPFGGQDRLYENSGPPNFALLNVTNPQLPSVPGTGLAADCHDVDNDGDYEVLTASDGGAANVLLRNITQVDDQSAPDLSRFEQEPDRQASSVPTSIRVHVYDNASWDVTRFNQTTLEYEVDGGATTAVPMFHAGGQLFQGQIPGNLTGQITYRATSRDRYGNQTTTATLSYFAGVCTPGATTYCTAKLSTNSCLPTLGTSGTPLLSAPGAFSVTCSGMETGFNSILFFGLNGPNGDPFQGGTLCVQGPVWRAGLKNSGGAGTCGGSVSYTLAELLATPLGGLLIGNGSTVNLQVWGRDPGDPFGSSLSNGAEIVVCQ